VVKSLTQSRPFCFKWCKDVYPIDQITISPSTDVSRARLTGFLLSACLALGGCRSKQDELPEKLAVSEVIASSSSGTFMEGCVSEVYRLQPSSAAKLIEQGLGFFEGTKSSSEDHRYSEWRETPVPDLNRDGDYPLASLPFRSAIYGCDESESDSSAKKIVEALQNPGSFYALTSNGEGMIFVSPEERLAAFFYVG